MEITLAEASRRQTSAGWELALAVTFHNDGPDPFELDKVTACALGRLNNAVFDVRAEGVEVPYRGPMKKRAHPGPAGFVHLAPGERVTYEVRLDPHYALPGGGALEVRFDHFNHFARDAVQLSSAPLSLTLA